MGYLKTITWSSGVCLNIYEVAQVRFNSGFYGTGMVSTDPDEIIRTKHNENCVLLYFDSGGSCFNYVTPVFPVYGVTTK